VRGAVRFLPLLGLLALAGSCNAQPAPKPIVKQQTKPVPAPAPNPPTRMGSFGLDRPISQGALVLGWVPAGTKRLVVDGQDVRIAPDGRFIVGFGRDYKATTLFTAFRADGASVSEKLPVGRYAWKIDYLNTLPHHAQPDAEFQARRPGELAQINAARRVQHESDGWRQRFIWPARGRISGLFGSQRVYSGEPGSPHSGVDVAGGQGATVVAPASGTVILAAASPFTLEGNLLMIDHGMGLNSAFLHLSRIDVRVGDVVMQGQRVGAIGMTGRATGPHLHWSMKWSDEKIDPMRFAGPM
jgi:murein DD-endopeptidase MepM/ murein hydrolase activator NlpD